MLKGLLEFWRKARSVRLGVMAVWVLGSLVTVLQLVLPEQVGRLTNLFAQGGGVGQGGVSRSQVNTTIALVLGSQVLSAVLYYFLSRLMDSLRKKMVSESTMWMYRRLVRFDPEFFHSHDAETINWHVFDDQRMAATFWLDTLMWMPLTLAALVVFAGFMVYTNWFLALCMIPLLFLNWYFLLFDRWVMNVTTQSRLTYEKVRSQAKDYIAGIEEIRPNDAFGYCLRLLNDTFEGYQRAMERMARMRSFFSVTDATVSTIQDSALYWLGATLCLLTLQSVSPFGPMTWGGVIQFMLAVTLFKKPVNELTGAIQGWRINKAMLESVRAYESQPVVFPENAPAGALPAQGDIHLRDVDLVTAAGTRLLNRITLDIDEGAHVALVGPAGCGKSTLIRLLFRSSRASDGQVVLHDLNIEKVSLCTLARGIGVVLQSPYLLSTTLRDNLLLALRRPSERTLRDAGGELDVQTLPEVYTLADLEREMLAVVRAVGLEADVLCKALDAPLPAGPRWEALGGQLAGLRQRIREKLSAAPTGGIVPFDRAAYLPVGTLRDNLLFGLQRPNGGGEAVTVAQIETCLAQAGLLDSLLQAGLARLRSDQRVSAALPGQTDELADLLRMAAPATGTRSLGPEALAASGPLRAALLQAALDADARDLPRTTGVPDFQARVVAARATLRQQAEHGGAKIEDFLTGRIDGLTLRELLLQGRVDEGVFRAQQQVDALLRDVLLDAGMLDEVLLAGLEYPVGENGKNLSGGQKQKVAIARTLLKRPSVLLLDEATSALDELSQKAIVELLRTRFAGKTMISISHRLSTIRNCDRIFVIDRGSLVQQGTFAELAGQSGLFQRMLGQEQAMAPGTHAPSETPSAGGVVGEGGVGGGDELPHELARCTLFASLKAEQLEILARVARVVRCGTGEVLFRRGDAGEDMFVILDGRVEFFVDQAPGVPAVIEESGPGEAFGEIAVFSGEPRTLGARTRTDVRLALLPRAALQRVLEASPALAAALLQTLARRISRVRDERYGAETSPTAPGK